jgi:hypothetical protein
MPGPGQLTTRDHRVIDGVFVQGQLRRGVEVVCIDPQQKATVRQALSDARQKEFVLHDLQEHGASVGLIDVAKKAKEEADKVVANSAAPTAPDPHRQIFELKYDGEFRDLRWTGQGKLTWLHTGQTYTGQFVKGKRDGAGVQTWPDGQQYDGFLTPSLPVSPSSIYVFVDSDILAT